MKKTLYLLFGLLIFTTSCEKVSDVMSDEELIDAIINYDNKIEVSEMDLPDSAVSVIGTDMPNDVISKAELAPDLGYEIEMKSSGIFAFELDFERNDNQYFTTSGRKLEASMKDSKWGDKKSKDAKDGKKKRGPCFKFVYPISYTMPDGSTISGNDRKEIHSKMKSFYEIYEKTKDSKEPQLNFPISILILDDDKKEHKKELADYKELKEAMSFCSRGKDKDGDGDKKGDDGKGKRG